MLKVQSACQTSAVWYYYYILITLSTPALDKESMSIQSTWRKKGHATQMNEKGKLRLNKEKKNLSAYTEHKGNILKLDKQKHTQYCAWKDSP